MRSFRGSSYLGGSFSTGAHRDIWSNFHSGFIFALPGMSQVSKETKNFKELESIGLVRCFSARIEKTSKNHKTHEKTVIFWHFFDVSSILGEKQRTKPKNLTLLMFFASFDTHHTPRSAKIVEKLLFIHLFLRFCDSGAT